MRDIFEIFAAMLAVWGAYSLLSELRALLIFPKKVRHMLRAAIIYKEAGKAAEAAAYADYLSREGKISPERLIILRKDDIMEYNPRADMCGDVMFNGKCGMCEHECADRNEREKP